MNNFDTVCPRSSDPFQIVTYYIKWVTTSWTDSILTVLQGQNVYKKRSNSINDRRIAEYNLCRKKATY